MYPHWTTSTIRPRSYRKYKQDARCIEPNTLDPYTSYSPVMPKPRNPYTTYLQSIPTQDSHKAMYQYESSLHHMYPIHNQIDPYNIYQPAWPLKYHPLRISKV